MPCCTHLSTRGKPCVDDPRGEAICLRTNRHACRPVGTRQGSNRGTLYIAPRTSCASLWCDRTKARTSGNSTPLEPTSSGQILDQPSRGRIDGVLVSAEKA